MLRRLDSDHTDTAALHQSQISTSDHWRHANNTVNVTSVTGALVGFQRDALYKSTFYLLTYT